MDENKGDLISRQAVDELSKELVHTTRDKADFLCNFWEGLRKLPSAENKGEWIPMNPLQANDGGAYVCSKCHSGDYGCENDNFCRWCGADMRGGDVSESNN